jgi:tRNA A-37 threonylcarbamoyl transferase component Bud32
MLKGGKLCIHNDYPDDIYTLGREIHYKVFLDKENENVIIKTKVSKDEYELSKNIHSIAIDNNNHHFTPNIYGFFECFEITNIPKLTAQQQRIKAWNAFHPNEPQRDLGEIKYIEKKNYINYLVMERINGRTLEDIISDNDNRENIIGIIEKYINIIYEYYNILCNRGYKLNDLFSRNIIITNNDTIMFIDFGTDLVEVYINDELKTYNNYYQENKEEELQPIPIEYRLTFEELFTQLQPYYIKKGGTKSKKTKKTKYIRNKNKKTKYTRNKKKNKYNKTRNQN